MVDIDALSDFKHGIALLNKGCPELALVCLRRAFECERQNPFYLSFLGLSIARAERKSDFALRRPPARHRIPFRLQRFQRTENAGPARTHAAVVPRSSRADSRASATIVRNTASILINSTSAG